MTLPGRKSKASFPWGCLASMYLQMCSNLNGNATGPDRRSLWQGIGADLMPPTLFRPSLPPRPSERRAGAAAIGYRHQPALQRPAFRSRAPPPPPSLLPRRASERAHKRARVRPPCQSRENERAKGFRQFLGGEKREDSIQQMACPVTSNTSKWVDWIPGDGRGNIMRESATSQPVSQ